MATTFVEYTGDGNATKQFTFPSYQESDVKVRVDGVLKTTSTHYNITSYTTTGGGNVVFTSGNIPSSPATIRIYRDTNVDAAKATFTAGSSVKAADLNNNTTQLLYRAQEEQIPNLIHSYDIDDSAIETSKIKADAITGAKIADDQINSEHYVDGSIDTAHIADSQITSAKIVDGTIVNADINASAAIAGTKIAPDFGSQNIATTGTVDGRDVSADGTKLDGIETAATADQTAAEIRTLVESATDSNVFTDADHTKLNGIETGATADQTNAEIRAAVEAATDSNVFTDADHSKLNAIEAGATADQTASEIKTLLQSDKLTANEIATNAVTTDKIADSELSTLAGMQSATASKLADSTALTADIADLNQIDGMAKQTTITDDDTKFPTSGAIVDYVAAQLEPFGGFEAIANESSFPNTQPVSGVVISIADAGGMVVSGSGTASGATVGGTTVNITGIASNFNGSTINAGVRFLVVSTGSGQNYTYHKATLKEDDLVSLSGDINDFSERYRVGASNPTTALDSGDLFFNTGSGKLLVYNGTSSAWEETQTVGNFFINTISSSSSTGGGSATANGTAYRFTLSNAGTFAQQHLVSVDGVIQKPNSGTSQPSEGFAIDGGDIIFGSAPVNGASLFVITIGASVSIGTPSNNTVTTAILQNGSVTTAKIVDANVTTDKLTDNAVTSAKITDGAVSGVKIASGGVTTSQIADDAVTAAKLASNAVVNASVDASAAIAGTKISPDFGSQNITTTGALSCVNANLSGELNLMGNEQAKNMDFNIGSNLLAIRGTTGGDSGHVTMATFARTGSAVLNYNGVNHLATNSSGVAVTGNLSVTGTVDGVDIAALNTTVGNITTDLVTDTTPQLGGDLDTNSHNISLDDSHRINFGDSSDLHLIHDGTNSYLQNITGDLYINNTSGTADDIIIKAADNIFIMPQNGESGVSVLGDGSVELYYNNSKKLHTVSGGIYVTGNIYSNQTGTSAAISLTDNGRLAFGSGVDLEIYHDGSNSRIHHGGSGGLKVTASDFQIMSTDGSEFMGRFSQNGSVRLYHNNNLRLETTSTGVDIDGDTDGVLNLDTTDSRGSFIRFAASGTSNAFVGCSQGMGAGSNQDLGLRSQRHIYFLTGGGNTRWSINTDGTLYPGANNTYDIGSSSTRVRNIYTNDLHLSNEGSSNDVDGSWGDWTIQEGESDLFLKNNRSGKKYKFNLTEVS